MQRHGGTAAGDDGFTRISPHSWAGVAAFRVTVASTATNFQIDRQRGQARRLWVLCVAVGMVPMLSGVAPPYGVSVASNSGFDSLTAKHDMAQAMCKTDAMPEVLHLGDFDPSGVHIFASLAEDVAAMVRALGGADPVFSRLAVTPAQIDELSLPTAPPKKTDWRAFASAVTVQAGAIAPDVLSGILKAAIEARQCPDIRAEVLAQELADRAELARWIGYGNGKT